VIKKRFFCKKIPKRIINRHLLKQVIVIRVVCYIQTQHMVIIKTGIDASNERELEIVNERGDWANGSYHLFAATFMHKGDKISAEPHDVKGPGFLGEVIIDKEKGYWEYKGDKLNNGEQKQVAEFILDYQAPDGVY
jgi:hypothetical protein